MKARDYISSGLLEGYVLGVISAAESEQVAGAICRFPEVAAEVEALESLLLNSERAEGPALPAGLEDEIWNAIQEASQDVPAPDAPTERVATIVQPLPISKPRRKWAMAAVWIGLFVSLGLNIFQRTKIHESSENIGLLLDLNERFNSRIVDQKARLDRYEQESEMAARLDMESVPLRSMQPGHPMAATLYLNSGKDEAYVSIHKLPAPPKGMQYQIWAIEKGKPRSIGMLNNEVADYGGMQKVPMPVEGGEAFALSLEIAGGAENPTPGRIYLMGKRPV